MDTDRNGITFDEAAEAARAISGGIIGAAELRGTMQEFGMATDQIRQAAQDLGISTDQITQTAQDLGMDEKQAATAQDALEEAARLLREIVQRNGPAGAATADALRQLRYSDDEIAEIQAARADYIRKRWPSQLSAETVAFAVEQGMSNDDIAGALYMAATKKRSHQAHAQASRAWPVPSAGHKRSLKSKRR